jgi:putative ABC transport system ATP-binding protein
MMLRNGRLQGTMTTENKQAQVRIRDLSRSFQEGERRHDVLKRLCIDFTRGETVALRGRSGSGKSTLLNLISGIDIPDAGNIEVSGRDITGMSEHERTLFRRKHIGFVYQAFNLVPTLSVGDNIRLVLELNGVGRQKADQRIDFLLDAVALGDRASSYPDVLSGGEQQRVAIARALAHEPPLLLADEPTGNLDDRSAEGILQLLDKLVRQAGGTMIIATHSASVADYADRVLELHDGALVS